MKPSSVKDGEGKVLRPEDEIEGREGMMMMMKKRTNRRQNGKTDGLVFRSGFRTSSRFAGEERLGKMGMQAIAFSNGFGIASPCIYPFILVVVVSSASLVACAIYPSSSSKKKGNKNRG